MKKTALLLGLLSTATLCLSACGNSKDFNMSFDEALTLANHSALQEALTNSENFQQSFNLSTNIDNWSNAMIINLQSESKQNLNNDKSQSSTNFDVNVKADDTDVLIKWNLDIKLLNDIIYLNLESLDFSSSEDTSFLASLVEWFKGQWYSISMQWLSDVPSSLSYIKDAKSLNEQAKEIIVNEWDTKYNWKFSQFKDYNAWKFSLDNEKIQELINDYYAKINETLTGDAIQEAPQLNIQNFEWYLVITWKNKVTTIIENMDVVDGESSISVNGFWGEDYEINISSNWEAIIAIKATKKNSSYNVSINAANSILLEWTISPKLSSSKIDVKFDATLTVKSDYEETDDTIIPLKWSWTYNPISDFTVEAPENAQDFNEVLSAYLGASLWSEAYDLEDYENLEIDDENTEWNIEESFIEEWLEEATEETAEDREATIDNESYFEWKDELKDYIYNNR